MIRILSVIVNGHWRPGIGDPTFMGWLITAAYLTNSILELTGIGLVGISALMGIIRGKKQSAKITDS
ncbi:MAG: hypothetical protein WBC05_07980 [Sedimentisphaerales bacterium]